MDTRSRARSSPLHLTHLSLVDFRNYRTVEVDLGLGAHTFVGANGQGKTNLVEAVGYLATLGSHRVSTDQALVREGAEAAIVRARVRHEEREILMELQINRGSANRAQLNRSPSRPRDLSRSFASVLFAPEDLALVRGDPGVRRRFLDDLLVQRAPRLAGVISDYERTLKQRNTLLKSARARGLKADKLGTLDVWDEKLVTLGSEIIFERLQLVDLLREPVRDSYRAVAGSDHAPEVLLELSVGSSEDSRIPARDQDRARGVDIPVLREAFASALLRVRDRELERGVTLVGPHRDDLFFGLNALPARGYASHGESWSFALALKLASAELLRRDSATGDPVLVLDDVFAELDRERRRRLAVAVEGYEQVLITAAVFEDVPEELAHHLVHIQAGAIVDG